MDESGLLSLEQIKREVLPGLFAKAERLATYGQSSSNAPVLVHTSSVLELNAVGKLSRHIAQIIAKMGDADPEKLAKKPSWLDQVLGKDLEANVRYQVSRLSLDELIKEADKFASAVEKAIQAIDLVLLSTEDEIKFLSLHIDAATEFLAENPEIGTNNEDAFTFDRPRERLARKIANMATLVHSHELTRMQLKMSRAQAVDLLDRFHETQTVLIPVWRHHTQTLLNTKELSTEEINKAVSAHEALKANLSKSLEITK